MIRFHKIRQYRGKTAAIAIGVMIVPWALAHAEKSFQDRRSADPQGVVELVAVSGSYEVSAAEAPEVTVVGTIGSDVDRVEITGSGNRTSIHVIPHVGSSWGGTDTHLVIHVPAKSEVKISLVNANLKINGVQGNVNLQSVSGDLDGDLGGDLRASTVNGTMKLTARNARTIEVKATFT